MIVFMYLITQFSWAAADIFLWRDKKITASVLGPFPLVQCIHLHQQVSTPNPDVILPEDIVLGVAAALRTEINKALESFLDIASGKELTKFLALLRDRSNNLEIPGLNPSCNTWCAHLSSLGGQYYVVNMCHGLQY
ncbi:hypothetical protein KY285_017765 [Solanum tuberosum]|nr:hypothetical protein KY285_017765 [Solanum tuberosum]